MPSIFPSNGVARRLLYELLHLWSGFNGYSSFNIGYSPLDRHVRDAPTYAREPYQIQLYAKLLDTARLSPDAAPRRILELGVGCGGGLRYLQARCPDTHVAGVDNSAVAVAFSRRKGLVAKVAPAERLPFPEQHFDLVVCVDSLSILRRTEVFLEACRVLTPGGRFLIGDYLVAQPSAIRDELEQSSVPTGFRLEQFQNETAGVMAALEADHDRKLAILSRVPRSLRPMLAETMSLRGSERYQNWQAGKACYYMAVLRKQAVAVN